MSSPGSNQVLLLRRAFVIVGLSAGPSASVSTCCESLVVDDGGLVWIKGSLGANMGIDARYQLPCYLRNHGLCLSLFCANGTEPSSSIILWSRLRQVNSAGIAKETSARRGTRPLYNSVDAHKTPTQHPTCQQPMNMTVGVSDIKVPGGGKRPSAERRNPSRHLCDSSEAQPGHRRRGRRNILASPI